MPRSPLNSDLDPLKGKTALVTGAGTGIGHQTAVSLAELGATVLITGRRADKLDAVAAIHPFIVPVIADVTTQQGADTVREAVLARGAGLDVLVHNAGIFRFTTLGVPDGETPQRLFDVSVFGPMLLTNAVLDQFGEAGGSVVFVSSIAGQSAVPGGSAYAASKAAQNSLTRSWALELAPRGIRVNAVAPAAVRTDVYAANGLSDAEVEGYFAFQASRTPLGRTGVVQDVVPWILHFADPNQSWVTGQIITLDGGAGLGAAA